MEVFLRQSHLLQVSGRRIESFHAVVEGDRFDDETFFKVLEMGGELVILAEKSSSMTCIAITTMEIESGYDRVEAYPCVVGSGFQRCQEKIFAAYFYTNSVNVIRK